MHQHIRFASLALAAVFVIGAANASAGAGLDTAVIEKLTGLPGSYSKEENVFKVSKARTDVKVQADGLAIAPFMGLTSWAAFTAAHDGQVMMMGDTVVFEDEVNPAMSAALDAGLEVTALHNHFFFDQPRVYFMHIGGMGSAAQLAAAVRKVYDRIGEVRAARPVPAAAFAGTTAAENRISAAPLAQIFGQQGEAKEGMFKVTVGRRASMHGIAAAKQMGVNTWAGFAGTDGAAVVDGDFVMTEDELQPVLKAMRAEGINIVAIHQHMTHEQPRCLFLHFWGKGKAEDLARSIRKVLDVQGALSK